MGDRVAVGAEPLEVADPDGHLGEVVGVGVDLDAVELVRANLQLERGETSESALVEDRLLQVFEELQGHVQEVARAARRVQDAN